MFTRSLLTSLVLLCGTQVADAHLRITSHQSRYGDTQKAGPCGQANGIRTTDKVYIAKPGIEVTLTWDEYINHPGYFRIDFDLDGDDGFVNPILDCANKTSIPDCFDTTNTGPYMVNNITDEAARVQSYTYTLPNVECDNCTLQIIQAMQDKPPYEVDGNELYFQCIDIVLDSNGPDTLTLMEAGGGDSDAGPGSENDAGPGSESDAGPGTGVGADAGINTEPIGGDSACGCHHTNSSRSGLFYLVAALGMFWFNRRRYRS